MTVPRRAASLVPAWWLSAIYAMMLLCIPTRLIVGPIGAPGTPANLFAIAGLLFWVCAVLGGLTHVRGITPLRFTFGFFVALVLTSYASGHLQGWSQPADIHQRSDRLWEEADVNQVTETLVSASDRGLLALAGWAGILLLTSEGIRSWAELDRVVTWIVRGGAIVAFMGILQYFTGLNVAGYIRIPGLQGLQHFGEALSRSELNRIVSTSAHPIELGVAMASILPLALHRSLHAKKWITWLPTMLIGTSALMSVSRSAIVVAAVALLVLFLGWPWKWRLFAVVAAPVLAVAGRAVLPGLLGTIRSLFRGLSSDPSIQGRTDDYPLVIRAVQENPLFGQGLFTWVPMVYRTIDNQALMMLIELGVIGTFAFGCLVLTGFLMALSPWRMGGTPEQRHLGLAIAAAILGIVSSYVTFDAFGFRQVAGLTFLYIGLGGAVWWVSRAGARSRVPADATPEPRSAGVTEAAQRHS
ncbi:MAG: hypothetical protein GX596_14260 [Propionibacterium sp.]|nr:hypothetical protein [Propionibacterium sp.]